MYRNKSSRECVWAGYLEIIASRMCPTFCREWPGCEWSLTCSGIQSCPHLGQFFACFRLPGTTVLSVGSWLWLPALCKWSLNLLWFIPEGCGCRGRVRFQWKWKAMYLWKLGTRSPKKYFTCWGEKVVGKEQDFHFSVKIHFKVYLY